MFNKIKNSSKKALIITVSVVILVACLIAGTIAFLQAQAGPVTNEFAAGQVPPPIIIEEFDHIKKENVKIKLDNTDGGDGTYFVRAAIIFTLQDESGQTVAKVPVENTDYTITYGNGWTHHTDGYWYYNGTVAPGESTSNLIIECETLSEEYQLVVDILGQTIQSNPTTAAQTEWGYVPGTN